MSSNAVLAELELMPLWQLRSRPSVPAVSAFGGFTALAISTAQGASGWALMSQPLGAEEEALFLNLLVAMKLRRGQDPGIDHGRFSEEVERCNISWLWLIGEDMAGMLDIRPLTATATWKNLPVFLSVHPEELLLQPEQKSKLWADWCRYAASAGVRL